MHAGSGGLAPGPRALLRGEKGRWRDLGRRAISAAVLAPIALACVWFGGVAFLLLIAAATALLVVEWARLCTRAKALWMRAGETLWILLAAAAYCGCGPIPPPGVPISCYSCCC